MRGLVADTRPLRNDHFRRLWLANIVTVIGAQLTVVAVPAQIYAETGSSAYVGLTGVFGLVPLVVFGLWGGALADVIDRRTILIITTLGLIATSALFWRQAAFGTETCGCCSACSRCSRRSSRSTSRPAAPCCPSWCRRSCSPPANSLNMTVMQAGAIAGPLVAGALIPVFGFEWLYLIDTITLLRDALRRDPAAAASGRGRDRRARVCGR